MKKPKLGLVIPCFNEEEVLNESIIRLINLLDVMIEAQIVHEDSTINFVDDGSTDSTWDLINTSIEKNKNINLFIEKIIFTFLDYKLSNNHIRYLYFFNYYFLHFK
jgi:glycosyltransferase involved in cell wall biosynthesis